MSKYLRKGSHIVSNLTCHVVWVTKYRYHVLTGEVQERFRDILKQICEAEEVEILMGVISKYHVNMHLSYSPKHSVSYLVKMLKGRSSGKLQQEFPCLKECYWGQHFLASDYGVWSTGNITDGMVNEYLEHHRKPGDSNTSNFILE